MGNTVEVDAGWGSDMVELAVEANRRRLGFGVMAHNQVDETIKQIVAVTVRVSVVGSPPGPLVKRGGQALQRFHVVSGPGAGQRLIAADLLDLGPPVTVEGVGHQAGDLLPQLGQGIVVAESPGEADTLVVHVESIGQVEMGGRTVGQPSPGVPEPVRP